MSLSAADGAPAARLAYDLVGLTASKTTGGARFELEVPSLSIARGEKVALVGPSGCGKSTLLDILALVLPPDRAERFSATVSEGETVDLRPLAAGIPGDGAEQFRGRNMGYVLQSGGLLPFLSVADNIALPYRLQGSRKRPDLDAIAKLLGIAPLLDRLPGDLSVGERQRVAVARAVIHRPPVILADEPTAALDPQNSDRVIGLLAALVERLNITLVVATHDWERVERFGFRKIGQHFADSGAAGVTRSVFQG